MDKSPLREKILATIINKSTLKQHIFDNTFTTFNELKDVLFEIASELDDDLDGKLDKRVRIEYRDRGKFEAQLQIASDLLIFRMHTDIFEFDSKHEVWENEYVKQEDIIGSVDSTLAGIISNLSVLAVDEVEAGSFKELALVWEDMPVVSSEEVSIRASRGSKAGFVKLVFNFLTAEGLMLESDGRYYPKDKFKALVENYFESYKGRLYEILRGDKDDATY